MPKGATDNLFQLIKSLSRAEKRHFKLYTKRHSSGAESLFIKLFDFLDKKDEYDEDLLLKAIKGIKKSQLSNVKSNLYRQLLVSLRLLHATQHVEMGVREMVDFAHILYAKGLYRQSLNLLDRAKVKSKELQLDALALDIISFEKLIESQHITRSLDTRAETLARESVIVARQVNRATRFSNLSLRLYGLYLKMGFARNAEDVEHLKEVFKKLLPRYEEEKLHFYERLYLYQSFVWLYYMTHEFSKLYWYANKWVNLFTESSGFIGHNINLYLKGLHNLLFSQYLTLQHDKFLEALDVLDTFNSGGDYTLTRNEESLLALFRYIHRINRHYLEGRFTDALEWIPELEKDLEEDKYGWDYHRAMVFYYRIACVYFSSGKNEEAIDYLNKIINRVDPNFREDIQSFARILSLIAHFELGNDVLVGYQLKSVYRFLSRIEELNSVHQEILKFLRQTARIQPGEIRDAFISLRDRLLVIEADRFGRRSFLYLDIISWLDSKIEDRMVEEVIRDKFLARMT